MTSGLEPSHNADLSTLSLSVGSLSPEFSAETTSYNTTVAYDVSVIDVTATAAGQEASVTINGAAITSGIPHSVSLNAGSNIISVVVTAQDGKTVKTYTINVTRADPSNNAKLSGLTTTPNSIDPVFDPDITRYNAGSVLYPTNSFTVTATAADVAATITINGTPVSSGNPHTVGLNEGFNSISVVVTAQDGVTTNTYTISVLRLSLSHNADLSDLSLSYGRLSPGFSSETVNYSTNVPYDVSAIDVTATAAGQEASIKINGKAVPSGIPHTVSLNVGSNIISIEVTAQDDTTVKTYTINITRAEPSHNADLSDLSLSYGRLSPGFSSGVTSYSSSTPYSVSSTDVTATAAGQSASIKINGVAVTSGIPHTLNLNVGSNIISVEVTAQDGTTVKTYTINITRAEPSHNAYLSSLSLSEGSLDPPFDPKTTDYNVYDVNYFSTSITVTPMAAGPGAYITVNGIPVVSGNPSGAISLIQGRVTYIYIVVTAQDGIESITYIVSVELRG